MSNARKLGNMTTHGLDGDFNVDPTDNTLVVDSTNNRVGIGSATPTTTLDITGTATATAFSGPLTGNVTGTTSSISNHDTDALSEGSTNLYFTNARADARAQLKIDALVDSAPGTLDTLNELASALGDDANFSTTITNSIATKLPLAGGTMTGTLTTDSISNASGNLNISSTQSITLKFDSNSDQTNRELNILHDNNTKVFTADENGDIKFYEDTGNTPKFFWDSSTESVQLGGTLNLQAQGSNVSTIGNNFVLDSGYKYLTSGAANMLYFDAAGNTMFFKASSGTAGNAVSFSETMRIDSSGNIKFGPNGEGYINGAAQNTYNSGFNVNADDFSTWINYSGYQGGTTKFRDLIIGNGKGSRVATIDGSSGNVGIGVTPSNYPAYRTIIKRDDNTAMPTSGISNEAVLALINDSTTLYSWSNLVLRAGTGDAGIAAVYQGSANNSDLILYTDGGNNGVERMRIKNNGNVGIGTTSPSYKLDVFNNTTDTGSQLRVKNAHTAVGADAVVNIDGYGASTLKLWRNGVEEWKLERITNNDNLGLYAYGGAVSGGAGAGLIQFWDYDTGNIGIGTDNPSARLEIYDSHGGNTGHSSYGHPNSGGSNGALYINKTNSRIDWTGGLVFCGEGTTWSSRFTGRDGLTTNSDTDGEILGVHPVEGSSTAAWSDTAGANGVTSAFFRVMGNGKTFVKKLNSDAFRAPSHATDAAANSAGGNVAGSIYYNTAFNVHRSYNGTQWTSVGSAPITESVFDAFRDGSALCLLKGNNSNVDTGGNHTGSLQGGATYTTTTKFGSHAFDLVGTGVYLDIPTLPMIETVSFWFYCVGGTPGYIVDFRHDNPNNGRSYLYTHAGASGGAGQHVDMGDDTTTTNRTGVIYINGVQYTSGQYNFLVGNWYHIVLVRNASDTHRTWDQGIRFGNRSDGTTHGNAGHFDQIRVFNSRISASQALDLYNETG